MATLTGTQDADVFDNYGDNYLVVTNDGDTIFGLGGNDYVGAGTGGDHIFGGEGNDELYSGSGDDVVEGGNGNDRLVDGPGDDIENGGPGDDSIQQLGATDDDHDIGNGGPGNDSLYTSSEPFGVTLGTAILHGDEGNDTIIMSLHGEAYGDDDDDQLWGWVYGTYFSGGAGNDRIAAHAGDDIISGGAGNDLIVAGTGADRIDGDGGNDVIYTYGTQYRQLVDPFGFKEGLDAFDNPNRPDIPHPAGDLSIDIAHGGEGNDTIHAGLGDQIYGDNGDDNIYLDLFFVPARPRP